MSYYFGIEDKVAIEVHSGLGAVADVLGPRVLPPDVSPQNLHLLLVSVIGGEPRVHWRGGNMRGALYCIIFMNMFAKSFKRNAFNNSEKGK